uniref:BREX system Lon protease-like protein BrxL n=1 Tax=Thiohalocapsa sp. TaxID=2497641 RepID=UPI0025DC3F35
MGFCDTVAFDEVGGLQVQDPDPLQIPKDSLANGRFSRGLAVIADARHALSGPLDHALHPVVPSHESHLLP